jgi:hypothetical protein
MSDELKVSLYTMDSADELQFCDPDIQEAFRGKNYIWGTPTQVQLARNLRELAISPSTEQSRSRGCRDESSEAKEP